MYINQKEVADSLLVQLALLSFNTATNSYQKTTTLATLEAIVDKIDHTISAASITQLDIAEKGLLIRLCAALGWIEACEIIMNSGYQLGGGLQKSVEDETRYYPPVAYIAARFNHAKLVAFLMSENALIQFSESSHPQFFSVGTTLENIFCNTFCISNTDAIFIPTNIFDVAVIFDSVETLRILDNEAPPELKPLVGEEDLLTNAFFYSVDEPSIALLDCLLDLVYGDIKKSQLNDEDGRFPLAYVDYGTPCYTWLISKGVDINYVRDVSALGAACAIGDIEKASNLLRLGAQIDTQHSHNTSQTLTPLHLLCADQKQIIQEQPKLFWLTHEITDCIQDLADSSKKGKRIYRQNKYQLLHLTLNQITSPDILQRRSLHSNKTPLQMLVNADPDYVLQSKSIGTLLNYGAGIGAQIPIELKPILEKTPHKLPLFIGSTWADDNTVVVELTAANLSLCFEKVNPTGLWVLLMRLLEKNEDFNTLFTTSIDHIITVVEKKSHCWGTLKTDTFSKQLSEFIKRQSDFLNDDLKQKLDTLASSCFTNRSVGLQAQCKKALLGDRAYSALTLDSRPSLFLSHFTTRKRLASEATNDTVKRRALPGVVL